MLSVNVKMPIDAGMKKNGLFAIPGLRFDACIAVKSITPKIVSFFLKFLADISNFSFCGSLISTIRASFKMQTKEIVSFASR